MSGAALFAVSAGPASAATYPVGGSTFSGGLENWNSTTQCGPVAITLLCSANATYDATEGNPNGSLADKTEITLNLLGIFNSVVTNTSPAFTVGEGGTGVLRLERQFETAELLSLAPTVEYNAFLTDRSTGQKQKAITDTVENASPFVAKQGLVSLVAGDSYAIEVEATTKSTVAGVGLLGSTTFHLDNIVVTGPGANGPPSGPVGPGNGGEGGNGGNGGNGGSSLSDSELRKLMESQGLSGPATLKGTKLRVKANCPAAVGRACKVTVQGMLRKGKPATNARSAKIAHGKSKKLALTVKAADRSTVKADKRLLFKMTVKAGSARTTVYKILKLIRS